jgi:ABC-type Fe3+-hydroxamate transport system substrate-binding protein
MNFQDQTGHTIHLSAFPQRVISLVPSQTELLFDLGLGEKLIGITKFCIHPDHWFRNKTRIGGTKDLNLDLIRALKPDLIIANKEENEKDQVEMLRESFPVWVSDVKDLGSAIEMIHSVAEITGTIKKGDAIADKIIKGFDGLGPYTNKKTVAYLIWRDPCMTVGGDSFINDVLNRSGFNNYFRKLDRYPVIDIGSLKDPAIDIILLSSEPFPFGEKHIRELTESGIKARIAVVDGELFSWYGSRLQKAPAYLRWLYDKLQ